MNHKTSQMQMFCYQCQETAGCKGCTVSGVCGKKPEVAAMQDLLVYVTKGLASVTTQLRSEGTSIAPEISRMVSLNLFTTITNANFDLEMIKTRVTETLAVKEELLSQIKETSALPEAALWEGTDEQYAEKAASVGVLATEQEDIRSLRELITYGLKGLAAYTKHANALLKEDAETDAFIERALASTLDDSLSIEDLTSLALETGEYGVKGMALLDQANTEAYGHPEITKPALMYTRIPKCSRLTIIRPLKSILTLSAIMEMPGGNKKKNLKPSTVRFL